jgi:demethylmenaquinone methyltransferase/2-methoxy-6-polyprenyl-1,4-benzoquinol methylase
MSADQALRDYYAARASEYDDWYLRRGRYAHGVAADAQWASELAAAETWLKSLPIAGKVVELAAGTGWWSPVLAMKGDLSIYDANPEPLAIATERLRGLGLSAATEVRDAWTEPDRHVDALFMGFWLSHVPRARLGDFLSICRAWVTPGGLLAFIDSRLDPESSARDHPTPENDQSLRRLADGQEFAITKIYWTPDELRTALGRAGYEAVHVTQTTRFFLHGSAVAG